MVDSKEFSSLHAIIPRLLVGLWDALADSTHRTLVPEQVHSLPYRHSGV